MVPYWSPDGSSLYYSAGVSRPFIAARLQREPVPAVLSLDTLFAMPPAVEPFPGTALHPDGDRFIFSVRGGDLMRRAKRPLPGGSSSCRTSSRS